MNCSIHKRAIEAFCNNCSQGICGGCIMDHNKHNFSSINETSLKLRDLINEEIRFGKLKKEYTLKTFFYKVCPIHEN